MVRVLKKKGKLLIVEYDRKSLLTRIYSIIARIQKRHCRFFTLDELVQYLDSLGLRTQPIRINRSQIAVIAEKN